MFPLMRGRSRTHLRSGISGQSLGSWPCKASIPKARRNGSREAIVAAAGHLFVERSFGCVSMDDLWSSLASLGFIFVLAC